MTPFDHLHRNIRRQHRQDAAMAPSIADRFFWSVLIGGLILPLAGCLYRIVAG
jgi:hypothetical protein